MSHPPRDADQDRTTLEKLSPRDLVRAVLDVLEASVDEAFGCEHLPELVALDVTGESVENPEITIDQTLSDSELVAALSRIPGASAVGCVRSDETAPRLVAWSLLGEARAVSRPVIEDRAIIGWRRGWLEKFRLSRLSAPITGSGAKAQTGQRRGDPLDARRSALHRLLALMSSGVEILRADAMGGVGQIEEIPDLMVVYDDDGEPMAWGLDGCLAESGASLDQIAASQVQRLQRSAHAQFVHIFRWPSTALRLNGPEASGRAEATPEAPPFVLLVIGLEWEHGISRAGVAPIRESGDGP